MKTPQVLKTIRNAAKDAGLDFETFKRTNHTGIRVGTKKPPSAATPKPPTSWPRRSTNNSKTY